MVSVIKNPRGDGFLVSWRDRKRDAHTRVIAKQGAAKAFKRKVEPAEEVVKDKIRFTVAVDRFCEILEVKGNAVITIERFRRTIERHVNPLFGRRWVHEMDDTDLRQLLATLTPTVGQDAAEELTRMVKRVLKAAQISKNTTFDPDQVLLTVKSNAANSGLPGTEHLRPISSRGKVDPDDIPSFEEARDMLIGTTGVARILIALGLLAGLRDGEILALKLRHIVFDGEGYIMIRQFRRRSPKQLAKSDQYVTPSKPKKRTKTSNSERDVPLDPVLRAILKAHIATLVDCNPERPLLESSVNPMQPMSHVNAYHHLCTAQAALGIGKLRDGRMHVYSSHRLRDACVSLWLHAGHDIYDIAGWIGHADIATTIRDYARLMRREDEFRQALAVAA